MAERILVVDDDPTIVRLLRMILEMEGYEVRAASNGKDALDEVASSMPDLLLCDVMMPGMDGLEVVARLRKDPETASLPIILLSARAQELDVREGRKAGADLYVTKPFEPSDLLDAIVRVLQTGTGDGGGRVQR